MSPPAAPTACVAYRIKDFQGRIQKLEYTSLDAVSCDFLIPRVSSSPAGYGSFLIPRYPPELINAAQWLDVAFT